MPTKDWLHPQAYLSGSQDEDTATLPPRDRAHRPDESKWVQSTSTQSAAAITVHGLAIWEVGDTQEEALGARMRIIPLEYRQNSEQGVALEGGVVPIRHYPRWLNAFSAIAMAMTVIGILIFLRDVTLGSALAAVGSIGVWIAGSLASSYRGSRYGSSISS